MSFRATVGYRLSAATIWTVAGILKKLLQRHQPSAKPEVDATTKARLVRPAQHPGVRPAKNVRPKRRLAGGQRDIARLDGQLCALTVSDGMDCGERGT